MFKFLLATVLVYFQALAAAPATFTFKNRGQTVKTLSLSELKGLLKPQSVKVYEPHEARDRVYTGFDFDELMTKVYGQEWKKAEEVLFTCLDGYQPSLPAARFLSRESFLVFAKEGGKFQIVNTLAKNKVIPLSPFYLVWNNLNDPEPREPDGWPYQVNTVDLISFASRFPTISPADNAPSDVKAGFAVFREQCMKCHRINGEGGDLGPELNYPVSVTEYFNSDWLKKWILDPSTVRYASPMPRFKKGKDSEKQVDQLIQYLKHMAGRKAAPKS